PLLATIQSTSTPYNPEDHVLFHPEMFHDGRGRRELFPPQVYEAVDLLEVSLGAYYTYKEIRQALLDECRRLKYDTPPSTPAASAASLVAHLNDPLGGVLLPQTTFFVPLSGIGTESEIPLGTATIVRPDAAKEFVRVWGESRTYPSGLHTLPEVREVGG